MSKKILIVVIMAVLLGGMTMMPRAATSTQASPDQTYLVLFKQAHVPNDAAAAIEQAGGSLTYAYDEIGVAIAHSNSADFQAALLADNRVQGVSSTQGFGVQFSDEVAEVFDASGPPPGDLPNSPVADSDPLSYLQWDMVQIYTPEAHAITGGSPEVLVGDIDSGVDWNHPDLAANIDFANSVSCVGGVPNQDPAAWNDNFGHGTHTAGTIAAAANGVGVVGVAPNVKLAAIKAVDSNGFLYPEYVVCAFMWAATHGVDVTNNSYFVDPWLYNCRNDPVQRAIWESLRRAIRYAMSQGVTVVASAGNQNDDLAHPGLDTISPDDGTPLTREITNACGVIPAEIPGVVTVSANGILLQKSYYSSYGVGVVDVVAPGGDARFQRVPPIAPNGAVLSTYPGNRYAYLQGTSMSSPHVAGVAALIISQYGKMPQGRVAAYIRQTADSMPCPEEPYNPGPPYNYAATCQGGAGYNSFFGHGQVNAYNAVTHAP